MNDSSTPPLVSVAIPVYNGESHIEEALNSILTQDYSNLEIIIANNQSTDNTHQICLKYANKDSRIRYVENEINIGPEANYEKTLQLSNGKYFTWLAHDDYLSTPSSISKAVNFLETNPDVTLCTGKLYVFCADHPESNKEIHFDDLIDTKKWPLARNKILKFPNDLGYAFYGIYVTENLKKVNLRNKMFKSKRLNKNFSTYFDLSLVASMCLYGRIACVPEVLRHYRFRIGASATAIQINSTMFEEFLENTYVKWRFLSIATKLSIPFKEKIKLQTSIFLNFFIHPFGYLPKFRNQINMLTLEVVVLRKACQERLKVINNLEQEVKKQLAINQQQNETIKYLTSQHGN